MNIKKLRLKSNHTQKDLALKLGYSLRTIQRHENGEQPLLRRHEQAYRRVLCQN